MPGEEAMYIGYQMYAGVCGAMVCANLALYTIYVITATVAGNEVSKHKFGGGLKSCKSTS